MTRQPTIHTLHAERVKLLLQRWELFESRNEKDNLRSLAECSYTSRTLVGECAHSYSHYYIMVLLVMVLTPHVRRIIYPNVIKFNINKA